MTRISWTVRAVTTAILCSIVTLPAMAPATSASASDVGEADGLSSTAEEPAPDTLDPSELPSGSSEDEASSATSAGADDEPGTFNEDLEISDRDDPDELSFEDGGNEVMSLQNRCGGDDAVGSVANKFTVLRKYGRNRAHPRMETGSAKLYCGKARGTLREDAFGIRHVRFGHERQLANRGDKIGYDWDEALDVWTKATLARPDIRMNQNRTRFCYSKRLIYERNGRVVLDIWFNVLLGETGQRIMTAFPNDNQTTCTQGTRF